MNPPESNTAVEVFDLRVARLGALFEEGSYKKMLLDINMGVAVKAEQESQHPDQFRTPHPNTLAGKHVLPRCKKCFVVRVTSTGGQTVGFLFEWSTLYNSAFYVESPVNNQRCWYIFKDFAKKVLLPPAAQFPYVRQKDRGYHILDITANYAKLGTKGINLGYNAIDGYIIQLFGIRAHLQHGNKLVLKEALLKELTNGPLTFALVVISEPSRFGKYKVYMQDFITQNVSVPKRFTNFFTKWALIRKAIKDGKGMWVNFPGEEKVYICAAEVNRMVCLLSNTVLE